MLYPTSSSDPVTICCGPSSHLRTAARAGIYVAREEFSIYYRSSLTRVKMCLGVFLLVIYVPRTASALPIRANSHPDSQSGPSTLPITVRAFLSYHEKTSAYSYLAVAHRMAPTQDFQRYQQLTLDSLCSTQKRKNITKAVKVKLVDQRWYRG